MHRVVTSCEVVKAQYSYRDDAVATEREARSDY